MSYYKEEHAPAICIAIIALLNLGFYSMSAPTTRALELSACREYYLIHNPALIQPGGYVDEDLCKIDSIQQRVAWFNALIGILHFCCGFVADRIGRKPILLLNVGGLTMSFAWTALVWPIFALIGGASHLNTALVYGEAATFTHKDNRTVVFSFLEATIQISQLIAPVIGSSLMHFGIFIPFLVSIPLMCAAMPLVFLLPDYIPTVAGQKAPSETNANLSSNTPLLADNTAPTQPLLGGDMDDDDALNDYPIHAIAREPSEDSLQLRFWQAWQSLKASGKIFMVNRVAQYALAAFLVVTLGKQSLHILTQYVSKRFETTIAQAAYLFSIKAGVSLFVFGVVLPGARGVKSVPVFTTNIWLAKASIVFLTLGVLWMGLAWSVWVIIPSLVVYAGGFAFSTLVRTLVTATVPESQIGQLYSGLALAETTGSIIGALFVTAAFSQSISIGGWWAGVPFYACSFFYGLIAVWTWVMDFGAKNLEYSTRYEE